MLAPNLNNSLARASSLFLNAFNRGESPYLFLQFTSQPLLTSFSKTSFWSKEFIKKNKEILKNFKSFFKVIDKVPF